jgi:leucyl aminopeptidase
MPMGKNWAKMIESEIADFQNIGGPYGGSTTAAEFLYKFVNKKTAWAHLDIAGMCWSKSGNATTPKGAVGFGVKTLFNIVDNTDSFQWFAVEEKMSY